jgi:uncharacterized protein
MQTVSDELLKFFDTHRNTDVVESRILRKVEAFIKHEPHINDCGACGNQIVVAPDGQVGICQDGLGEEKFFIGEIYNFSFSANPQIQEWAIRSPFNMDVCLDCHALGICGGGCPYGASLRHETIWDMDDRFCVHSKTSLEWLVWDLYSQMVSKAR